MKPAAFEYWRPDTLDEAVDLLARLGEDAKVLAGGQSLVPMMNFRLVRPAALVDIGSLPGLGYIRELNEHVEVGGLTRHVDLERTSLNTPLGDLMRKTAERIGHLPIRVRGTIAGSVAHADPAAEWCLLSRTLDANIVITGPSGQRTVSAEDFYRGYFTTVLEPEEIVTALRFPGLTSAHHVGFREFARRAGDFAIVAAATAVEVRRDRIIAARIGLAGVADRPVRSVEAETILVGAAPGDALFDAAAQHAASTLEPPSDVQASSEDRRDLVRALVHRALTDGFEASRDVGRSS